MYPHSNTHRPPKTPPRHPAPLIYLNAYPGTGKLTIARALASALGPPDRAPALLLDVHQLVDPVAAAVPDRASPLYLPARAAVRAAVLRSLASGAEAAVADVAAGEGGRMRIEGRRFDVGGAARRAAEAGRGEGRGRVVACTDAQVDNAVGPAVAAAYRRAARDAGRPFVSIVLVCGAAENERRLLSAERAESGTTKLRDVEVLRGFRGEWGIYKFGFEGREVKDGERVEWEVEIDVTDLPAEEAAARILDVVRPLLS